MTATQTREKHEAEKVNETTTWPEFAIRLFEELTGRRAEISYQFENFELSVPSKVGKNADHALWKMNGVLTISTSDQQHRKNSNHHGKS